MRKHIRDLIVILFLLDPFSAKAVASDTAYIRVHFLYGSKPRPEYKKEEARWFGGILGGHVGIEFDSNQVINFLPQGDFHYVACKKEFNSAFVIHSEESFWEVFGGYSTDAKKLSISIPVSLQQKNKLDSIASAYTKQPPYDYAFIGMRCASATYDILSQLGILKPLSISRMCKKNFYPKKLRKRMLKLAAQNHWYMQKQGGTERRKWERD